MVRQWAVQGQVAIHKRHPPFWIVRAPWKARGTAIAVRDLCVRSRSCGSLIGQSVITWIGVSKVSLLTSLLTTCQICE
ncbi:unnamed protein product [Staurois parvus]|uniref:Uncharacterized protein n=1 Tax=Staurois parvus TaxID=386267 RepID=A0ABN9BAB8_9NEOB|nr:unnamed protein product [Staurois parvus]